MTALRRLNKLCLILGLAVLGLACDLGAQTSQPTEQTPKPPPVEAQLGQPFQLQLQQVALVKSEQLELKFLNVTEDSRCPVDVQCVWAGRISLVLAVTLGGRSLGEVAPDSLQNKTVSVEGYTIELGAVTPPRRSNGPAPGDGPYAATLVVSKKI